MNGMTPGWRAARWKHAGVALFTAMAMLACAGHEDAAAPQASDADTIAFVDVDVLPMDRDAVLSAQTVLVRDGRIVSMGPSADVDVPTGAQRIDGRGKVLMPGLAEMHGHVPGGDDPQYVEDVLFLYIANGVTFVRNMAGNESHLALRDRLAQGELDGPTMVAASPWLGARDEAEINATLQAHHAAGYDLAKLGSVPADLYPGMARTAHALGIPFAGHIPEGVALETALDARQASIDHFDRYVEFLVPGDAAARSRSAGFFGSGWVDAVDAARIPEAVQRTIDAGTWNVPTLSLVEHLASPETAADMIAWPEMRYMPQSVLDGWVRAKGEFGAREDFQPAAAQRLVEVRRQLLKALHDRGAPIALGSDAPQFFNVPGFSIHHEMRMMVAAGMTPYEVLATGTTAPARYMQTPGEFGVVAPGARADLVLLDADPRQDIGHFKAQAGVMVRGRWWPADRIRARLETIAARRAETAADG
ncbi:amidohydrolase [Luteimonas aestuarii]|uniref:Amidohydrolase n=1 Tax=Luteimonas aestuarii TaxID=453837 RepID=A0A4R5U3U3_9GAMM|nr:amidohydrolase family protein [Luteimonas aestuarii]TDK28376.1 amidohydrolase [Luteimonas aestuarii]